MAVNSRPRFSLVGSGPQTHPGGYSAQSLPVGSGHLASSQEASRWMRSCIQPPQGMSNRTYSRPLAFLSVSVKTCILECPLCFSEGCSVPPRRKVLCAATSWILCIATSWVHCAATLWVFYHPSLELSASPSSKPPQKTSAQPALPTPQASA